MEFYTLPKALYSNPVINKILYDNQSCILFKRLETNLLHREKVCTSHCFVFVLSGYVEVTSAQGNVIRAGAGEVIFMPRDAYLISDFLTINNSIEMYLVFIEHDIVSEFLSTKQLKSMPNEMEPITCKVNTHPRLTAYFKALGNVYQDFHNDTALLKVKLLEFLHLIYAHNPDQIMTTLLASEQHKKNRNLTTLMRNNFDKNLSVADFASMSGRSLSSFNRDFKRKFEKSPKQWLIEQRMGKAQKLLANGVSVTESAFAVGYNNLSHFIKSYKSIYGVTPKAAKKVIF